jgi:hypothetical protein
VACFLVGGRITVIVDPIPSSKTTRHGKIVAASFWLPPGKRLAIWMVPTLVRAGVFSVVKNWGLRSLLLVRISTDYPHAQQLSLRRGLRLIIKRHPTHSCIICSRERVRIYRSTIHGICRWLGRIQNTKDEVCSTPSNEPNQTVLHVNPRINILSMYFRRTPVAFGSRCICL